MRIVLDTSILVRGHVSAKGLARDLLVNVLESGHVLLLADEMLFELAKVLRYPRMMALHRLSEGAIFHYIGFLRHFAEIVRPDPLLFIPIRDLNDTIVMQSAIIGDADVICTRDQDFFCPPAEPFLRRAGIEVLDDITLMRRLRH